MRLIFWCPQCIFIAQKLSGEAKTDVQKKLKKCFSKKVCLSTLCGPKNSQTYPLVMYFWNKLSKEILYLAIPWQSSQTWSKTEKLTNIPPPSRGGLIWEHMLMSRLCGVHINRNWAHGKKVGPDPYINERQRSSNSNKRIWAPAWPYLKKHVTCNVSFKRQLKHLT